MKKFLVFLLIPLFSFSQEQLTGEKIIDHINEFFSALNIKNYNKELLRQKVTSDFIIFEMGERFSLDEFANFIESSGFLEWESTNWVLSDFIVSIDVNSAHVSYLNTGTFIYPNPYKEGVTLKEDKKWLESVYIVLEGEELKIKFLQSDDIYSKISVLRKSS